MVLEVIEIVVGTVVAVENHSRSEDLDLFDVEMMQIPQMGSCDDDDGRPSLWLLLF